VTSGLRKSARRVMDTCFGLLNVWLDFDFRCRKLGVDAGTGGQKLTLTATV
jgi:hypothetical protein